MKCEKCNKNEAMYYYKETVNGKSTEKHLCADCAHEEGLDRVFESRAEEMFRGFDRAFESFFSPGPFFDGFFSGRSAIPSLARTMLMPMLTLPRIEIGRMEPETEKTEEASAGMKKDEALCRRRELNALRHQLREAVRAEDFEKAIELRDKIKELEK